MLPDRYNRGIKQLMRGTLLTAVIAGAPDAAAREFMSGNYLYGQCSSTVYFERGFCQGYIIGVINTLSQRVFCFPDSATAGQAEDVVKQWLEGHPEVRHLAAERLVALALFEAFPCRN